MQYFYKGLFFLSKAFLRRGVPLFFSTFSLLLILSCCILLSSCLNYYRTIQTFNTEFERGNLADAQKALVKDKKADQRNTRLLYNLNMGVVASVEGKYEESNQYFERAYQLGEDYRVNYMNEAASFFINPAVTEYKGEDFELLMVHYYKALNFLKLGNLQAALVECRRMDIKLGQLSSKYTSEKKYKRDAFIHTLMGIIYEANGDDNNAFIAYRNAVEAYQDDYKLLFGLNAPQQLKEDLLRSAYRNGFWEELQYFEKQFGIKYQPSKGKTGEVVFLWHNGLGPVKSESALHFSILRGQGGVVNFSNPELNLFFSFPLDDSTYYKSGLSQLEFIRVAFPKYVERPSYYQKAHLVWNNQEYSLEKAEDLNAIAFKSLQQRMVWEVGKSLLRVALKKASEYSLRKENENMGAILGIVNALTEHADIRNWQSIPHSIYYTRLRLPEGEQQVTFIPSSSTILRETTTENKSFTFRVKADQTIFHTFHSMQSGSIPSVASN